jgi:phage repressor protein C with HTH and peptisase S24 domain
MPESTFRSYFEGIAMSLEAAERIAAAGGVSVDWLATGRGLMRAGQNGEPAVGMSEASLSSLQVGGLFPLPRLMVHQGLPALRESELGLAVPHTLLAELGVAPEAAAAHVVEDAMSGARFPTGTRLIVDTEPKGGMGRTSYYVLVLDGGLIIRLVARRADGGIDLVADHPDARPETVPNLDKLTVAGRIVWAGGPV